MLAMLFFILSSQASGQSSCVKEPQVKDLQAICDEATKNSELAHEAPEAKEKLACETKHVGDKIGGPTLKFGILSARSKIDALLSGMERRSLQNSLPEKCDAPCSPMTRSVTALRVQPAAINKTWKVEDGGDCTNEHFGKSMVAKKTFSTAKSASCRKSLQDQASSWVRQIMVDEKSATIEWDGKPSKETTMIALCPDPCSYYSDQVYDIKETASGCEVSVTLNVNCARPRKGLEFQAAGALNVIKSCEKPK